MNEENETKDAQELSEIIIDCRKKIEAKEIELEHLKKEIRKLNSNIENLVAVWEAETQKKRNFVQAILDNKGLSIQAHVSYKALCGKVEEYTGVNENNQEKILVPDENEGYCLISIWEKWDDIDAEKPAWIVRHKFYLWNTKSWNKVRSAFYEESIPYNAQKIKKLNQELEVE